MLDCVVRWLFHTSAAAGGLFLALALPPQPPANDEVLTHIEIVGQIIPNDLPDKERRHPCKIHTLRFRAGKVYVLEMISTNFDAWLRIADSDNKTLAQDDDSGGNLNARIRFTAPKDDIYQIVATSYAGGAGTYTLKVRLEKK